MILFYVKSDTYTVLAFGGILLFIILRVA